MNTMKNGMHFAMAALLTLLAACGDSATATNTPKSTKPAPAGAEPEIKLVHGYDRIGATTRRGELAPIETYQKIDVTGGRTFSGQEVQQQQSLFRNIYWSKASFNAPAFGADVFPEIAREKDAFKRADLAAAKQAELASLHRDAASFSRVAALDAKGGSINVQPYDAQAKVFRVNFLSDGEKSVEFDKGNGQRGNWNLTLVGLKLGLDVEGGSQLEYRPADESEARRIEAEVAAESRGVGPVILPVVYYGEVIFAGESGLSSLAVVRVDGVAVLARDAKTVLMRFDRKRLGSTIGLEFTVAKILGAR